MGENKKGVSRDLIIHTTLRLIEEKEGLKEVNLRGIAKEIKCAHTNLYNYFNSFDEIMWESLGAVLLKMIHYVESNTISSDNDEEVLYSALEAIVTFSVAHPWWYRLIWLEPIEGEPSPQIAEILIRPAEGLNASIKKANGGVITDEKASSVANILYSYLHGEVCKWINGRTPISSKDEMIATVMSNLKRLYTLLVNDPE
ncbi:TetR/AcrR family transcriptional regulator [Anoxynatronum sibiricum]|uniref:TetR/AcrR family transcriptional regulator n=1 Tax=Anoxynatronum sibiricum TaxID=210623 RepID=A0ABU9VTS4_9CLOT